MVGETRQRRGVVENRLAADLAQQPGQPRVGLVQPAPEGDAVGLVDDALGIEPVQIGEHGLAHQLGVQRRDAVDAMRADKREMAHPHVAAVGFVDDRQRRAVGAVFDMLARRFEMRCVDPVDDFEMARQHARDQIDRPALQRLGQQRVVGIGERADGRLPRHVPRQRVDIDQEPHHFGDCDARMRVVELDRRVLRQRGQIVVGLQVPAQDVLQRGRDEEILLPQPQFAAGRGIVARVEDFRDRLGAGLLRQRADMVALVEHFEAQRIDGARRPQPQRVYVPAAPADDRRVVGDRLDRLVRPPNRPHPARRDASPSRPGRRTGCRNRLPAARTPTDCRRTASPRRIPAATRRGSPAGTARDRSGCRSRRPGMPRLAMLSIRQAASRPRPPLPSAASGSARRIRSRSTPRSPSAAATVSVSRKFSTTSANSRPIRNSRER